jgi:glutaredoxin
MTIELTLYGRADCELCREMEDVIAQEAGRFAFRLEKIDIGDNPDLEERFGQEVPVLFVNGRKAFKYRCTARELRKRLSREVGPRWPFRRSPAS